MGNYYNFSPPIHVILSDLISIQISALVLYYLRRVRGGVPKNIVEWPPKIKKITPVLVLQKSTGIRFKKVVFETFYG